MKFIDPRHDTWHAAAEPESPQPAHRSLLTLGQWQAVRQAWPAEVPVGVALPNDSDVESLTEDLARMSLITLHFPKWTDGRAYSQARLLRARLGYGGEVRATGEVLVDMLPLLQRTGFDAVELRDGQQLDSAQRALRFFAGHYQGDTLEPRPAFARGPVARVPEASFVEP